MKEEGFAEIGIAIQNHREQERLESITTRAVGRALCTSVSTKGYNGTQQYWIINQETDSTHKPLYGDGKPVYKNSKMGGVLIRNNRGKDSYVVPAPNNPKRIVNKVEVTIHNKATYSPTFDSAQDINITWDKDERNHIFATLEDLTSKVQEEKKKLEEALRKQDEARTAQENAKKAQEEAQKAAEEAEANKEEAEKQKAAEAARKAAEEEAEAAEREKRANEDIARIESNIHAVNEQIKERKSFIRRGDQLRSQHLLDATQETAKRSHLFDGVPIVIEGGPGTGKTTTMIQRLKFLISDEALKEEKTPLTETQRQILTDPLNRHNNWIFFSPTPLLLRFLRQNMVDEELRTNQSNTTTLSDFRNAMLNQYMLVNPDKDGPFKIYNPTDETSAVLIKQPVQVIIDFEKFLIRNITGILSAKANLSTTNFDWHGTANKIKEICIMATSIKNIEALMRLFDRLKDNESANVKKIENEFKDLLRRLVFIAITDIKKNANMVQDIVTLFNEWADDGIEPDNSDDSENEMDEAEVDEDESEQVEITEFEPKLFQMLKPLLRNLSLRKYDSKQKISKRQEELFHIIKPVIDFLDLSKLGEKAWFVKNYAFLCRGTESNILNQIPRLYKNFRRKQLDGKSACYRLELLEKLVTRGENKRLHADEQDLLIGFINHMLRGIYRQSRTRFDNMKRQKYINAYRRNVKYVIGVDEATDYSVLDYYFIVSFRHYEFSCVTLCGDIMQGLNGNGIKQWTELNIPQILPGLEVCELTTSYRQLPTLVEMSKQMYLDDQQHEAPFNSQNSDKTNDPEPLKYVSDDEEEKVKWITKRIVQINKFYNRDLPSVGIFVGETVDIDRFINLIKMQDNLGAINVVNGTTTDLKKAVRVYHLSQVKGMEFEVAIFHNIDTAIQGHDTQLMRRYLYVGISRASSFLAATFNKEEGNEDILKYFSKDKERWQV